MVISGQRRGAETRPRWASALVFIGRSSELFPSCVARSTPSAMRPNQSKRSPSTTTSGPLIAGIRVDGRRSVANRVAVRVLAASTGTNSRAYWNFESSSLQGRVRELSVPSEYYSPERQASRRALQPVLIREKGTTSTPPLSRTPRGFLPRGVSEPASVHPLARWTPNSMPHCR
jgi:hypothetical protein